MADIQLHPSSIEAMFTVDYLEVLESSNASLRANVLSQIMLALAMMENRIEFDKEDQMSLFNDTKGEHIIRKVSLDGKSVLVGIEPKRGEELVNINISTLEGDTDYYMLFKEDIRATIAIFTLVKNAYFKFIICSKK